VAVPPEPPGHDAASAQKASSGVNRGRRQYAWRADDQPLLRDLDREFSTTMGRRTSMPGTPTAAQIKAG
jgi:hypothetical protein